jgi:hypothetical protein
MNKHPTESCGNCGNEVRHTVNAYSKVAAFNCPVCGQELEGDTDE